MAVLTLTQTLDGQTPSLHIKSPITVILAPNLPLPQSLDFVSSPSLSHVEYVEINSAVILSIDLGID